MDRYEKTINLKTIWETIVRRWHIFFMIFIPVALISYIVTDKMLTKTYISTISVSRGAINTTTHYSVIKSYFSDTSSNEDSPGAVFTTAKNLKEMGITHQDGSEITINEISSGLSFESYKSDSLNMSVSLQTLDGTINKKVLDELARVTIINLKARNSDYANMYIVGNGASTPVKNSKERTYFLISLAAGFVVAFGIPFVDEIVSDEVYDKYDIESLGCSAFEVKAKPKKKEA